MAFSTTAKSLFSSYTSDAKASITGKTSKALLLVETAPSTGTGAAGGNSLSDRASAALSGGVQAIAGAGAAAGQPGTGRVLQLPVQYNPSSISFRASTSDTEFRYLQQNMDPDIPAQHTQPASIVMSVRLIFEQINIKDCFMLEKFKVSTQDVAQLALNKGLNQKVYSVQTVTNAFIGMLMSEDTRTVTFQWAGMSFTGEVSEARAEYKMFSIQGRPVYSEVMLNLSQRLTDSGDEQMWNSAFDKCFTASGSAVAGGKKVTEGLSNLLNIGI